jgi:hypothetical protein
VTPLLSPVAFMGYKTFHSLPDGPAVYAMLPK